MDNDEFRIEVRVSAELHEALRTIAIKNKRTLRRQVEWLLERYVKAEEEDAA